MLVNIKRWSEKIVPQRELLAVIICVRHIGHNLWGRKFRIRTDHASFTGLLNFEQGIDMLATVRSIESPTGCDVDGRWAGRGLADYNLSTARPASVQPPSSQCTAHVHPTGDPEASHSHAKWLIIKTMICEKPCGTFADWNKEMGAHYSSTILFALAACGE